MRTSRKIEPKRKYIDIESLFNDAQKNKVPLIFKLTRRTIMLLFLYLAFSSIFFLIGNYQQFEDRNLLIIIQTASITAGALILFSLVGIIESFVFMFRKESKKATNYPVHIFVLSLILILSFAFLFIFSTLDLLSQGVNP